jgi:hypothetical protein
MKTTVKILIAGAVTAMAATFSTGASAASLIELHEQHKAQILNFLFGGHNGNVQAAISVGPAYQAPPVYVEPNGGHYGYRGPRGYERRDGYHGDYRSDHPGHGGYSRDYENRDGRGFNR